MASPVAFPRSWSRAIIRMREKSRIPPLTGLLLHGSIRSVRTTESFSRDMEQTFISKPTFARPRVSGFWLDHAAVVAMDGTVSGRTIG